MAETAGEEKEEVKQGRGGELEEGGLRKKEEKEMRAGRKGRMKKRMVEV